MTRYEHDPERVLVAISHDRLRQVVQSAIDLHGINAAAFLDEFPEIRDLVKAKPGCVRFGIADDVWIPGPPVGVSNGTEVEIRFLDRKGVPNGVTLVTSEPESVTQGVLQMQWRLAATDAKGVS